MEDRNKISYEEAIEKLNKNLEILEENKLTLEDSVKLFEESTYLYKVCEEILENYQGKVEIILKNTLDMERVKFDLEE